MLRRVAVCGGSLIGLKPSQPATAQQSTAKVDFTRAYGGSDQDVARSLVQTNDGGYALAGSTNSFGSGGSDGWLVKTDVEGNKQFTQTYGGSNDDGTDAVVQTPDDGFALAGYTASFGSGSTDFWLVKTDVNGNKQFTRTYGGSDDDGACSLVETSDGGFALAGHTDSFGSGDSDFWLVKTDVEGNEQFARAYGGKSSDAAYSLIQTLDGGYALTGWTESFGASNSDVWLVKTDAIGNTQFTRTYGGGEGDEAYSLMQTLDGGYMLVGWTKSFGSNSRDVWLVKTDAVGNVQSTRTYGGSERDRAWSLVRIRDGSYALAGRTNSFGGDSTDFWLVKTKRDPEVSAPSRGVFGHQ